MHHEHEIQNQELLLQLATSVVAIWIGNVQIRSTLTVVIRFIFDHIQALIDVGAALLGGFGVFQLVRILGTKGLGLQFRKGFVISRAKPRRRSRIKKSVKTDVRRL